VECHLQPAERLFGRFLWRRRRGHSRWCWHRLCCAHGSRSRPPRRHSNADIRIPAELADIALQNKREVYDLLFRAAAETMLTIAGDPRHLGARIGITAVLHSWGSALTHNPHS
jgi:hypothetical protein